MSHQVHLLSGGAAQGLVSALQPGFEAECAARLVARFGAVGAMQEALRAGEPCDLMITTDAMVDALVAEGLLRDDARWPLGQVRTGIAVPADAVLPEVATPQALAAALRAADAIYFPDPERATAGIHFAGVLRRLGLFDSLAPRLRSFPNGATAMRALAQGHEVRRIGCTQVTEIRLTEGVRFAGLLPEDFELSTLYTAAVTVRATAPQAAQRFGRLLGSEATRALRLQLGIEP